MTAWDFDRAISWMLAAVAAAVALLIVFFA